MTVEKVALLMRQEELSELGADLLQQKGIVIDRGAPVLGRGDRDIAQRVARELHCIHETLRCTGR